MTPGQRATVTRRFEPETLAAFSRLVGIDIGTTVPEPLIGALFSYLLGVELPGAGTNYLKQDLVFLKLVPADAALTATVEISTGRQSVLAYLAKPIAKTFSEALSER